MALSAIVLQHASEINARVASAFKHLDRSEEMMRSAGYMLDEAERKCRTEWHITYKSYIEEGGISKTRAWMCVQVYRGTKTVEQIRAENAASKRKCRAERKPQESAGRGSGRPEPPMSSAHTSPNKHATSTTHSTPKALHEPHNGRLLGFLDDHVLTTEQQQQVINFIKELVS